jgi:hypothetical protein
MKTKISATVIALFFLMACGSSDQSKTEEEKQPEVAAPSLKFKLKASNMMYVAINADSLLVANQSDPTKAEVFERIILENGKVAIKASSGRFISDNRVNNSVVDVIREQALAWEEFELIAIDDVAVNIRSSTGKYVSANYAQGDILMAISDKPSTWETFTLETK